MSSSSSVRNVSRERWQEAQAWERDLWVSSTRKRGWRRVAWPVLRPVLRAVALQRAAGDDWNHWWSDHFDNYSFLSEHLGDYIEVGCGPYTNTRLIFCPGHTAMRVVCSDPLAATYLELQGPLAFRGPPRGPHRGRRAPDRGAPVRARRASTSS